MQTPVSNYGNFGAVASSNWNAAQERALRDDIHHEELDFKKDIQDFNEYMFEEKHDLDTRKLEMEEATFQYKARQRAILDSIAKQKSDLRIEQSKAQSDFKDFTKAREEGEETSITKGRDWYDYIDLFGIGDESYWQPEDISYQDWAEKTGTRIPDTFDINLPDDAGIMATQYYSQLDPATEGSLGMNNTDLINFIMGK